MPRQHRSPHQPDRNQHHAHAASSARPPFLRHERATTGGGQGGRGEGPDGTGRGDGPGAGTWTRAPGPGPGRRHRDRDRVPVLGWGRQFCLAGPKRRGRGSRRRGRRGRGAGPARPLVAAAGLVEAAQRARGRARLEGRRRRPWRRRRGPAGRRRSGPARAGTRSRWARSASRHGPPAGSTWSWGGSPRRSSPWRSRAW